MDGTTRDIVMDPTAMSSATASAAPIVPRETLNQILAIYNETRKKLDGEDKKGTIFFPSLPNCCLKSPSSWTKFVALEVSDFYDPTRFKWVHFGINLLRVVSFTVLGFLLLFKACVPGGAFAGITVLGASGGISECLDWPASLYAIAQLQAGSRDLALILTILTDYKKNCSQLYQSLVANNGSSEALTFVQNARTVFDDAEMLVSDLAKINRADRIVRVLKFCSSVLRVFSSIALLLALLVPIIFAPMIIIFGVLTGLYLFFHGLASGLRASNEKSWQALWQQRTNMSIGEAECSVFFETINQQLNPIQTTSEDVSPQN